jgi:hypothetical protein
MALPITDWQNSLDEMQTALSATLAALDRYQAGWDSVLTAHASASIPAATTDDLEFQLREWDARLQAATDLAASVESELHDRELTVGRWRQSSNERRMRTVQYGVPRTE